MELGPLDSNLGGGGSISGPYFTSCREINSRWVKELNIKKSNFRKTPEKEK
jgi:hypothetical protein